MRLRPTQRPFRHVAPPLPGCRRPGRREQGGGGRRHLCLGCRVGVRRGRGRGIRLLGRGQEGLLRVSRCRGQGQGPGPPPTAQSVSREEERGKESATRQQEQMQDRRLLLRLPDREEPAGGPTLQAIGVSTQAFCSGVWMRVSAGKLMREMMGL